jgi:hypothetical protein
MAMADATLKVDQIRITNRIYVISVFPKKIQNRIGLAINVAAMIQAKTSMRPVLVAHVATMPT